MAVVVNETFDSTIGGFSAGTWTGSQGNGTLGGTDGAIEIGAGVTATQDFTGITSGKVRLDLRFKLTDTTTGTTHATIFYLLPNGTAVASGSSIVSIAISRNTGDGATSSEVVLSYRNTSGGFTVFPNTPKIRRHAVWYKMSVVADTSAKTCDIYFQDVLWLRAIPWPNAAAADVGRVALLGSASAPSMWFDDVRVESAWALPTESVLVSDTFTGSGSVASSAPTDSRNIHAQNWVAPTLSTYGVPTRSANGLTWEASKKNVALARCGKEGIFVARFKAASSGSIYGGLQFRVWGGFATDAYYYVRYWSASGLQLVLAQSTTTMASSAGLAGGVTIAAGDEYEIKVELRGRYVWVWMRNVTTAGSFQLQLSGPTGILADASGARGLLCEELAGPFADMTLAGVGATNYCTRFEYTGLGDAVSVDKTIGDNKYNIEPGSIKELYRTDSGGATENLFWSRGLQFSHRAENDLGEDYAAQQQTLYDGTNVAAYRQTGILMSEDTLAGRGDSYITLLRRGPWVEDGIVPFSATWNFAPDNDFRPTRFYANGYRKIGATGASTLLAYTPEHDWRYDETATSSPTGFQMLGTFPSGDPVRLNIIGRNNLNMATNAILTNKFTGDAAPISHAQGRDPANVVDLTEYRLGRAWLIESAASLALDDSTIQAWRDDVKTPATLTSFTSGSLKTDAAGDADADGFNERHGWYEITCSGGVAAWTLPVASGTRHMPAFRLHGWTSGNTALAINGSAATVNVDYVIDEVASGVAVLQLLSNRTANTGLEISAASSASHDLTATGTATASLAASVSPVHALSATGTATASLPASAAALATLAATATATASLPASVAGSPTVTLAMIQRVGGAAAANLTGLRWAFFDQVQPHVLGAPTATGSGATTDASGNLVVNVTGTSLTNGQVGFLVISDTDGTLADCKSFAAPVQVAI